ncbi:MAG: aminotransferase class V-fold PLP-dependent enzyme [Algoriphagus sp.]|nr:aminotransferase class V-fold PLP-dependent enzyme [Algoriphagus sp.]
MKSRRSFLQKLTAGIAVPTLLGINSASASTTSKVDNSLEGEEFWAELRKSFPLTKDRVYMNNGTFGPAPNSVLEALNRSLTKINTSGEYGNSDQERVKLADYLGIKPTELSLTHNTTEGINIMAWGLPLQAGDEVILTKHEHAGSGLPWLNRAKLHGIVLKTFEPSDTQEKNLEIIKNLVTSKTKVIGIPHVTCTTGLVFPIKEISEFARGKNIYTAIDGAHGAGSFDLNLKELGCDFYAGCYHKWMLGPSGTGFLYVKEELLDELQAIQIGGHTDSGWDITLNPPVFNGYVESAHRYDYGTQSKSLFVGVAAATDFHLKIGKAKIESRIRELNEYLYQGLTGLKDKIEILTPSEPQSRISLISFRPKNMGYQELGNSLAKAGFRIRQVPEGGVNAIRVSTHIYNSKEEIDNFLIVTKGLLA